MSLFTKQQIVAGHFEFVTRTAERYAGLGQCIESSTGLTAQGYPRSTYLGRRYLTSRLICALAANDHPDTIADKVVLHKCDNPSCINPEHLQLGTRRENIHDMIAKGRQRKASGESSGKAKLTQADAHVIRHKYSLGKVTSRQLGAEYGVSHSNILAIVTNKTWKNSAI